MIIDVIQILSIFFFVRTATSSNVILSSLQVNDHFACPGEVVYTCEIYGHGSHAIAWSSDNYIGTGGVQLLFTAQVHDVGSVLRSATVPTTFAILTINNQSNAFLKSELHIIVPPNSPPGSVRCHDIANAIYTTGFQVIGKIHVQL